MSVVKVVESTLQSRNRTPPAGRLPRLWVPSSARPAATTDSGALESPDCCGCTPPLLKDLVLIVEYFWSSRSDAACSQAKQVP